jgi:uncharacterized membrane protein
MQLIQYLIDVPIVTLTLVILIIFRMLPPKKMGAWYGYRTTNSMKSQEHWDLGQKLSADSGIFHMGVLLFIQIAAFLFTDGTVITRTWILILWIASFAMIITGVEKKLKQFGS